MYDVIVVGGGICGLYFAHKYKGSCLLLEQSDKLGGRSYSVNFHDVTIALGTGIGLYGRDTLLLELMNELQLDYNTYLTDMENVECLRILTKLYKKLPNKDISFYNYIREVLTMNEVATLLSESGYTDYLEADARITLLHYGLQYNYSKYLGFGIRWNEVIEKISRGINYKLNSEVLELRDNNVITEHKVYKAKNIVVATTISTVRKLLKSKIYNHIRAHTFLRIYAYFTDTTIMKKYFSRSTKTYNILHFIHPIRDNVWMIAYTDGNDAIELNEQLYEHNDIELMEGYLYDLTREQVKIDDMMIAFWEEGTHYMTKQLDVDSLRHPHNNTYVIGECVSLVSGWTSPALELVENLVREL